MQPTRNGADQMPEIRKYKKRFNSEINCASLWGVNLLIGTNGGLLLLDRSGQVIIANYCFYKDNSLLSIEQTLKLTLFSFRH